MGISLVLPDAGHKAGVSHSVTVRDIDVINKKDSVSASKHAISDALYETAEAVGKAVCLNVFFWTRDKVAILQGFSGDFVNHGICTGGTPAGFRGQ